MLTIGHFVNWVPCEVFAVAFLAFVLGTRMRIGARIGWTVVLAICCAKFWLFAAVGGNRYNPVLSAWIILILNLMFSWAAGIAAMGLVWWHRRTRVFPRKSLALGGVNDFQVCCGKFSKDWRPDVAAAFASATNGEFRVLLQHQPKDARENIARHNVDLQLSGHTHGGFMPGISTIISRASNGFIRGLYPFAASIFMFRRVADSVHGCQFVSSIHRN